MSINQTTKGKGCSLKSWAVLQHVNVSFNGNVHIKAFEIMTMTESQIHCNFEIILENSKINCNEHHENIGLEVIF